MVRWTRFVAVVATLAVLASACGDDGGDDEPTPTDDVEAVGPTASALAGDDWETVELRLLQLAAARFQLDLAVNASFAAGGDLAPATAVADIDLATVAVATFADELRSAVGVALPPSADAAPESDSGTGDAGPADDTPEATGAAAGPAAPRAALAAVRGPGIEASQDPATVRGHLQEVATRNEAIADLVAGAVEAGGFHTAHCFESVGGWWYVPALGNLFGCTVGYDPLGSPLQVSGEGPPLLVSSSNGGFVLAGGARPLVLGHPPFQGDLAMFAPASTSSAVEPGVVSLGEAGSLTLSTEPPVAPEALRLGGGSGLPGTDPFVPPAYYLGPIAVTAEGEIQPPTLDTGDGLAPELALLVDPAGPAREVDPALADLLSLLPAQYRIGFLVGWNLDPAPPAAAPSPEACRVLRDDLEVRIQFREGEEGEIEEVVEAKGALSLTARTADGTRLALAGGPRPAQDGFFEYPIVFPVGEGPAPEIDLLARNRCGQAGRTITPGITDEITAPTSSTTTLPVIGPTSSTSSTVPTGTSTTTTTEPGATTTTAPTSTLPTSTTTTVTTTTSPTSTTTTVVTTSTVVTTTTLAPTTTAPP